jgi:hypothetical protein
LIGFRLSRFERANGVEIVMRTASFGWGLLLTVCGAATAQAGTAVTFSHPERYTDAEIRRASVDPSGLKPTLSGLESHLQALGNRYLPPDQTLRIEVLDIDLAGRYEPGRPFAYDVRVMRETDWPRIALRYTLTNAGGSVLAQGEDTVRDMNYLHHVSAYRAPDELRYEKAMLDDWFQARFTRKGDAQAVSLPLGN